MPATWEALRWYPRKELVGDIAGEGLALALCHDVPGASGSLSVHTCKTGMTPAAASQSCWYGNEAVILQGTALSYKDDWAQVISYVLP